MLESVNWRSRYEESVWSLLRLLSPVRPQLATSLRLPISSQNTRKDVSKRSRRHACGSCVGRKCHQGTHAHWGAPQSYNLHGILFSYTATLTSIIVSQAIVHANFHPCGNFGHSTVFFFPRGCTFTSVASASRWLFDTCDPAVPFSL